MPETDLPEIRVHQDGASSVFESRGDGVAVAAVERGVRAAAHVPVGEVRVPVIQTERNGTNGARRVRSEGRGRLLRGLVTPHYGEPPSALVGEKV